MGFLIREVKSSISACRAVLLSEEAPDFNYVHLSDPDTFVAGGLHRNPKAWEEILADRPLADTIKKIGFATKWILYKLVNILRWPNTVSCPYALFIRIFKPLAVGQPQLARCKFN